MAEQAPRPKSSEFAQYLRFPEGWRQLLKAEDRASRNCQQLLRELAELTREAGNNAGYEWARDEEEINRRWRWAIEQVAEVSVDVGDRDIEEEVIETALLTFQANVGSRGWAEMGLAFEVPKLLTGVPARIDLREAPMARETS